MIRLATSEIEGLRTMLKTFREPTIEATEFIQERLMALCDTALLCAASDMQDCDHVWDKHGCCVKCDAEA